jgi:hypothetical protein
MPSGYPGTGGVLLVLFLMLGGFFLLLLGSVERLDGATFRCLIRGKRQAWGVVALGTLLLVGGLLLIGRGMVVWLLSLPQDSRDTQLQIAIGLASIAVVAISALLLYLQIRRSHEWNRRRAAHDLIFDSNIGRFRELRNKLEDRIKIHDTNTTYTTDKGKLNDADTLVLESILNYLENVCLAVKNHVVDEDIAYECLVAILVSYRRWADPYIRSVRGIEALFYIDIDSVAERWDKRKEDAEAQMRAQAVAPGKMRL